VCSVPLLMDDCLLDAANRRCVDGVSVGERVLAQGRSHLWGERRADGTDTIVVHYMSAIQGSPRRPFDTGKLVAILCDCGVSSHYLIARSGRVLRLVPEDKRAWHCGGSLMPEPDCRRDVNDFSVGIELAGTHTSGFTAAQYRSLACVCSHIAVRMSRHLWILGHEHVAGEKAVCMGLRGEAKTDPGPLFRWHDLAARLGCPWEPRGIGIRLDRAASTMA
jgi:N-acetyl-anhydromuramyl-L-alanine amidase AmpD